MTSDSLVFNHECFILESQGFGGHNVWGDGRCNVRGPKRGSGGRKSPNGVQGRSSGRGSGGLRPPEAAAFCDTVAKLLYDFVAYGADSEEIIAL